MAIDDFLNTPTQTPNPTPSTQPGAPVGTPPPTISPPQTSAPAPKKRHTWVWILIILLALLGAGLAVFGKKLFNNTTPQPVAKTEVKNDVAVLRYGTTEGPINVFYPGTGLINGEYDVNQQVFEGLVRYDNQTRIIPLLATSWTNPDDSTWIFTLKSGVKFHTGRTMTAKDVKDSIDYVKANNPDLGGTFAGTIKSVEAVDDSHVKIVTDGPDPVLLNKLTFLYVFDTTSGKKNNPINGSGPYQVKPTTTPSEKETDLVAFDDYHGGHVYVRELQFVYYDDEGKLADDLKDGKLNIGGSLLQTKNLQKVSSQQQITFKSSSVNHLGFNTLKKTSPVSNVKVRRAIYLATDPEALFKVRGIEGEAFGQIVGPDIPGYNPAIKRPIRDTANAKKLLKEAGYPNGVTISLSVVSPDTAGQELVRQLKEAGITAKLDVHEDLGSLVDKIFSGEVEMYNTVYSTDVLDAIDVFNTFFYKSPIYNNAKVTALIDEANKTTDQANRLKLLQQVSQAIMDDTAWAPLSVAPLTWASDKPYIFQRDVPGAGLGVYFWKLYTQ